MKNIPVLIALLACLTVHIHAGNVALAQKPVNGNGNLIEQIRPLTAFTAISLDFTAEVTIVNGETPSFVIKAEENLMPFIGTQIRRSTLHITQDRWIQPTQPVVIEISTPFLSRLETSGYSTVQVENLDGPRLQVNAGVGKVSLSGKSGRVLFETKTGNIDASALVTPYAEVSISSHGVVRLGTVEELVSDLSDNAVLVVQEQPGSVKNKNDQAEIITEREFELQQAQEVAYIAFTLVNNSRKKLDLRVEGPRARSFGYGFPLRANQRRAENWPVGSKVYIQSKLKPDELLLTITQEMEGESIQLFGEE